MRIAFLALIAISLLAALANADKEVQKSINKAKKPILLKQQPLKREHRRLPPRPPQPPQLRRHHTSTVHHHPHPKIPTSALKTSASVRHSRKIKAPIHPKGQLKKHKIPVKVKGQKRRRVYKKPVNNNVVQSKKPSFPQKISNFNRFLRFFGRQIQRPVFPIHENRRKFNIRGKKKPHPLVVTKAENIAGYSKFTLDEVVYPDKKDKKEEETVKERSDQEDDIVLVDGINPRNVNGADKKKKKDNVEEEKEVEKEAVVENADVR